MKKLLHISLIILLFGQAYAQESDTFTTISSYFQQNDYEKLSNQFAQNLDLTIGEIDGTYGKQQASVLMKAFLTNNKTISIKMKHQGASNERTHYAVYDLKTKNKNWSVYILLNKDSHIIQLQIED
jgi:hypothetical protein